MRGQIRGAPLHVGQASSNKFTGLPMSPSGSCHELQSFGGDSALSQKLTFRTYSRFRPRSIPVPLMLIPTHTCSSLLPPTLISTSALRSSHSRAFIPTSARAHPTSARAHFTSTRAHPTSARAHPGFCPALRPAPLGGRSPHTCTSRQASLMTAYCRRFRVKPSISFRTLTGACPIFCIRA